MTTFLINCLYVGAGGFIGSILRYLISLFMPIDQTGFPWTTLFINTIGAFLIGFIAALFTKHLDITEQWSLLLQVGLCGGLTTFSAFSLESLQLIQKGELFTACLYVCASCIVCIIAVFVGQHIFLSLFASDR